ncbi:MAG: NAD(P)/FAD-dependent oxidoreductase [Schleiferiaceae bacterium]|nr:NAD(P)/FAD-dependent oxidoreductase [Schleiferiaceae bacterium]
MKDSVQIAGAGLVGSLLALYLRRRGYPVDVYEGRPDARKTELAGGRSINLALSDRGLKALERVGLAEKVLKTMAIPMYGRMMHDREGALNYQAYGKENQCINSVSRSGLNALLMDEAEAAGAQITFEERCHGADYKRQALFLENALTGKSTEATAEVSFGTDGAFSAVRQSIMKTDRFNYSQHFIEHGYKELTIPPGEQGSFRMEKNALHIWPRGHYMLIALPNPDGSFTCTLFLPFEGDPSFDSLAGAAAGRRFFEEAFPDALAMMPDFDQEWEHNPAASMVIIRCFPWSRGRTAILGDASHAIVPFYGQGMNSGFEDCRVLDDMLAEGSSESWEALFDRYERQRKPDADAIADLAMRNFVEMRDLTGDPDFLLQKKIEARFAERHPASWTPLYSLVTFSPDVRYSEALERGRRQDAIMAKVMARPDIHDKWDSEEVMLQIHAEVQEEGG